MARRVIASAVIEVSGDSGDFLDSLDRVQRSVIRVGETVEREFREAFGAMGRAAQRGGEDVEQAFSEIRAGIGSTVTRLFEMQNNIRDLGQVSGIVGETIERELREGVNGAARSMARLAADGRASGEEIESAFREAASLIDDVFESLDNGNVFTGLASDAERAGERIEGSMREAARQSESHLRGVDGRMGGLTWGRLGAIGAGAALVHLTAETARFGFTVTQQIEQAEAQFRGLTGSEAEAQRLLKETIEFARDTPFALPGLTQMTAQLLAVGKGFGVTTDNVLDFMGILGDATSALGQGDAEMARVVKALGQMSGAGRVLSQDMNQLTQALPGFNPWQALAKGVGVSEQALRKMAREGTLTAFIDEAGGVEVAIGHILAGMEDIPGAAGAMERQMGTLAGVLEKFKDTVGLSLSAGLAPFVEVLKEIMSNQAVLDVIAKLAEAFGTLLTGALTALVPYLVPLVDTFARMLTAATPLLGLLEPLALVFGILLTAIEPLIGVLAAFIEPLIGPLTEVLNALQPAIHALAGAFATALNAALIAALPAILALVDIFVILSPLLPPLVELFVALATQGIMLMVALLPLVLPILESLATLLALLVPPLTTALIAVTAFVEGAIAWFQRLIVGVYTPIATFVKGIINFFTTLYNTLVGNSIIPNMVNAIIRWFTLLWNVVTTIVNTIRTVVTTVWNAIKAAVETVVRTMVSVVTTLWNGLRTTISTVVNGIRTVVTNVWNAIKSTSQTVWNGVKSAVETAVNGIRSVITNVIVPIKEKVLGVFRGIRDAMGSIWSGIKSTVGGAVDWIVSKIDALLGPLDNIIGKIGSVTGAISGAAGKVGDFLGFGAQGGIIKGPGFFGAGEGGRPEALVPMTDPGRAMQVMRESGLDQLVLSQRSGRDGPLVEMNGTIIQDATDADLVAQRTMIAMTAMMVPTG